MIFVTRFAGAHQWEIRDKSEGATSNYDWTCTCGQSGHIASARLAFALECWATHASQALEQSAVDAIRAVAPDASFSRLSELSDLALTEHHIDQTNILLMAANEVAYEEDIHE